MTTLYMNPQVTDFHPTEDDDVVFTWGTGTFPDITARSITIEGGSNITVGSFTTSSLTINNGAYFKSADTQDISCNTVNIQGGAGVDIYGHLTSDTYAIGNGAQVRMHGGLTTNSFDFGGGFDLTVDGQFSVGGETIVDER